MIEHSGRGPMAVCGHHTGGVVAVELAAARPHLVDRLILSSTPWIDAGERGRRALEEPIDTVESRPDGSHLLGLWNQRAPFYGGSTDRLTRFVRDALRADDPAAGHRAVGRYRMEDAADRIRCEVTLVEHAADPFASPHTPILRERFDAVRVEVIEDGQVPLEATATAFASALLAAVLEPQAEAYR